MSAGCTRCENGWMTHPSGAWAVSCPNCAPSSRYGQGSYWINDGTPSGRVTNVRPPDTHESQRPVPMPDYARDAIREAMAKIRARSAQLDRKGRTREEAA